MLGSKDFRIRVLWERKQFACRTSFSVFFLLLLLFPEIPAAPELTDTRLVLLSNEITSPNKLRTLAMVGLNINGTIIDSALQNNRDDITEAAYKVLKQWRDSQSNKTTAYTQICQTLRDVKMDILITETLQ